MIKNKLYILMATLAFLGACSDEPEFPRFEGNIEDVDGLRVSIFHLLADKAENWEIADDVTFTLVDPSSQTTFDFNGSVIHNTENGKRVFTCRLNIGDIEIPDGTYFVTVAGENVSELGLRTVRFFNNVGTEEETKPMKYSDLDGNGTEADPYMIASSGDFLILLSYLLEDPNHGYGQYFKQTRSFELPRRSQVIDGKVWAAVSFSGNYDGGGHRLHNLTYQGASDGISDSGIGLFKDIYASNISNVTLSSALLSNTSSNVGLIAGSASGNCILENISVEGTVMANGSNIGGLIGSSKADLTLKNITISSLTIAGDQSTSQCVGTLVGFHEKGNLYIDGVSTSDHIFSLTGADNVGGLVGKISATGKNVTIKNALLEHSVDHESNGVKIINGDTNIGGLVGYIAEIGSLSLYGNQLKAPVKGNANVGGLIGYCSEPTSTTVERCQVLSTVNGGDATGGLFGSFSNGKKGQIYFEGDDNMTRLVLKSSAAAEVTGKVNVGGLFGYLKGNSGKLNFNSKVEIAVNINAADRVGGAFGYVEYIDIDNTDCLNFSSNTMKVTASDKCAGGVAGFGQHAQFYGSLSLDPVNEIPKQSAITTTFNCVVTGPTEAGGIVGVLENGTVKGLATAASITAHSSVAAGIVAKGTGTVTECAFLGTATCPVRVAGILGYAHENSVKITKCINYSSLSDATYLGGIMAHYENNRDKEDEAAAKMTVFISECYNQGTLMNGLDVGGIVACVEHPSYGDLYGYKKELVRVENCGNVARLLGKDNSGKYSVGGVAGSMLCHNMAVRHCANTGLIQATGVQKTVGGVVGHSGAVHGGVIYVEECMNDGEVRCDVSSTKLGGVVGHQETYWMEYTSQVKNCLNWGHINSDQKDDTGGILGYAAEHTYTLKNYNRGSIRHGNAIIGTHNPGTKIYHADNYYYINSGGSWPDAIMVDAGGLVSAEPYHNLDFENVWILVKDQGPMLRNCPFQPKK
ncbi:MAG: hypothetical protein K2J63_06595 [Muribaculaceae bacterium]|nr:hypothetical protein [Muribaculaceae bacterium]